VSRDTVIWSLVAFFGASVAFRAIIDATEGESFWVTLALEVVVLAAIVGLIVFIVRRQEK
jgi:hypothetical protein